VNLCESLQLMMAKTDAQLLPALHQMAEVIKTMISDALNAFTRSDIHKAQATIAGDNIVDVLNDQILEDLLSLERIREVLSGPTDIAAALTQLMIARSLERIADLSTNLSEEVIYMVEGSDIRHRQPPADKNRTDTSKAD
jgi:phosphate transport system protein